MAFPYHAQETRFSCGAASMRMALASVGIKRTEKQLRRLLRTNTRRGTWHDAFPRVAETFGLSYTIQRDASLADLKEHLRRGFVIIVCYYCLPEKVDHYAVLKRIDARSIHLWDPWFGPGHTLPVLHFMRAWRSDPRYDDEKRWFFALKKPQQA